MIVVLLLLATPLGAAAQSPYQRALALGGRLAWDPNYCNDTGLQGRSDLTKTALGAFIGYPCDPVYFACEWSADGWRSFRRECAAGKVFDPAGIQNCTFKDNVPDCAREDVNICSGACISEEFEFECCLSEECKAAGKRCDGKMDCTFEEDELNCPICKPSELPCATTEKCVLMSQRCDGTFDCDDHSDERFCDVCEAGNFYCAGSKRCVDASERCNDVKDCTYGEDEIYCWKAAPFECGDGNATEIAADEKCDGTENCPNATDEADCPELLETTMLPADNLPEDYDAQDNTMTAEYVKPGKK